MTPETLLMIKSNLVLLNVVSGVVSFLIGISPLFTEKEKISKERTPFLVELSAIMFLIFSIFMITLDFLADIPLYKNEQCLKYKTSYLTKLEYAKYYDNNKKIQIKQSGSDNYLVLNLKTRELYELPIKEDYKYQKVSCFAD